VTLILSIMSLLHCCVHDAFFTGWITACYQRSQTLAVESISLPATSILWDLPYFAPRDESFTFFASKCFLRGPVNDVPVIEYIDFSIL